MTFGIIGTGRFGKLWATCLSSQGSVIMYQDKTTPYTIVDNFTSLLVFLPLFVTVEL